MNYGVSFFEPIFCFLSSKITDDRHLVLCYFKANGSCETFPVWHSIFWVDYYEKYEDIPRVRMSSKATLGQVVIEFSVCCETFSILYNETLLSNVAEPWTQQLILMWFNQSSQSYISSFICCVTVTPWYYHGQGSKHTKIEKRQHKIRR